MSKKLAQTSEHGAGGPDVTARPIHCPACACEISSDGKSLIKRSAKFEEFANLEGVLDKIETRLKTAQEKITALEAALAEEKKKHVEQKGATEQPKPGAVKPGVGQDAVRPSWFARKK